MTGRIRRSGVVTALLGLALTAFGAVALAQPASATGGDQPPGANGSVKIDEAPVDSDPSNEPHVGCGFTVQFFGFDEGTNTAEVVFTAQDPSGDAVVTAVEGRSSFTFEGGNSPSDTATHTESYKLDTEGLTATNQGVHIKVDVKVTDVGGKVDFDKYKVFWTGTCEDEETPTPTPTPTVIETPTEAPTGTPTPTATTTGTPSPGPTAFDGGIDDSTPAGGSGLPGGLGWIALLAGAALLIAGLARLAVPVYRNRFSRSA
ncbi:hypothetical protein [Flindersiella endophytica]